MTRFLTKSAVRLANYAAVPASASAQPYALTQQFAAKKQVAYAIAGYPDLERADLAEDLELFQMPPVDNGGALRHAAYWTAVAARILDNRWLGTTAGEYAASSTLYPVTTLSTDAISSTLHQAYNAVQRAIVEAQAARFDSKRISEASKVATMLSMYSQPTAIAKAQEEDSGPLADLRKLMNLSETLGKIATVATLGLGAVALLALSWGAMKLYKKVKR